MQCKQKNQTVNAKTTQYEISYKGVLGNFPNQIEFEHLEKASAGNLIFRNR